MKGKIMAYIDPLDLDEMIQEAEHRGARRVVLGLLATVAAAVVVAGIVLVLFR